MKRNRYVLPLVLALVLGHPLLASAEVPLPKGVSAGPSIEQHKGSENIFVSIAYVL